MLNPPTLNASLSPLFFAYQRRFAHQKTLHTAVEVMFYLTIVCIQTLCDLKRCTEPRRKVRTEPRNRLFVYTTFVPLSAALCGARERQQRQPRAAPGVRAYYTDAPCASLLGGGKGGGEPRERNVLTIDDVAHSFRPVSLVRPVFLNNERNRG